MPQPRSSTSDGGDVGERLKRHLTRIVELTPAQVTTLERHYVALVRWNRVINLTSIRTLEEAVVRHYCESLFLGRVLADRGLGSRILDYGSGAGFPGFPIAVLRPDWQVTLLEAHERKGVFLRESSREQPNVSVLSARGEDVKGQWDVVVSRAVASGELIPIASRLAGRIALLVGADSPELRPRGSGPAIVEWEEPIKVPWGSSRWAVLGTFHVEP